MTAGFTPEKKLRRSIRGLALVPFLVGAGRPSSGQQPPGVVFRSDVDFVEVDAFVADAVGEGVRGLRRQDFQVFEEGVRQEITAFAEVEVPVARVVATGSERAWPDVATNQEGIRGRIYAVVLDELHTDARRAGVVRALARQFIERHMGANDVAAVVFTGGTAAQAFTGNRRLLLEAVSRFAGRKTRSATLERLSTIEQQRDVLAAEPDPIAPRPGIERDPWDLQRAHDARAAMETLAAAARGFGDVEGRRKAILLFSEGIDYDTLDVMGKAQRSASAVRASVKMAIEAALRHSVAIYTVDPRGSMPPGGPQDIESAAPAPGAAFGIDSQSLAREVRLSQDSLRTLAEPTGGIAAVDTNDFAGAYDRVVRASSRYYLLGYHPADFRRDGAFRRLEVRVDRPDTVVVARVGYLRPSARPGEEKKVVTAAAPETSADLRALLDSPWPQPGLTLGVTAAAFRGDGRDATVAVTIELPGRGLTFRPEGDRAVNEIEVSMVAVDTKGRVQAGDRLLAQPRLGAETRELVERSGLRFVRKLALPPGRYQLRVAAREAEEGRRGSVSYDLEVPDFGARAVSMSGVLVTSRQAGRALTPSVDEALQPRLGTPPTAARVFEPGDVLTAYAEVYDGFEPARDVVVDTRVATVEGREVFRTARLRRAPDGVQGGGSFEQRVEVPLADLGPGEYVLTIQARPTTGEDTASRAVPFEVVRLAGSAAAAPLAEPRRSGVLRPSSRIDRLEAWLEAVERHVPGTADEPAFMVRSWTPVDLHELATDVAMVVALMGNPGYSVMWVVAPAHPGRPERAPYSTDDEQRLRALAVDSARRCAEEPCARNRLLRRGAILHTDASIRVGAAPARPRGGGDALPERWAIPFRDGQPLGREEAPGHWELAQALLDNVVPGPEKDETVRLWYRATSAYGQYHQKFTRLEDRAVQLFPGDADILLLAGSLHEAFASPRIQRLVRSIRVPEGVEHGVGHDRSELRAAEKLLRRALAAEPGLSEARIRLGRVLYLQGRHEPAARELQQASSALSSPGHQAADDDGLLLYYAEMFLGAAREALGSHGQAKVAYARAAALYPRAPSARIAQSQLALRDNDRAAALAAVQVALRPPAAPEEPDDPWWWYHRVQGRRSDAWLAALYASLQVAP